MSWEHSWEQFAEGVARGTGRLIARVATRDGQRRPVAWLLDTIFVELADELERRGVPRRTAADMFGISRRTLMRRVAQAREAAEVRRLPLRQRVYDICRAEPTSREGLAVALPRTQPAMLASVVADMVKSNWLVEDGETLRARPPRDLELEVVDELVRVARMIEPSRTPEDVAQLLELTVEQVAAQWSDEVHVREQVKDDRGIAYVLQEIATHTLTFLGDAVDGDSDRLFGASWWASLRDKPETTRKHLHNLVHDAGREIQASFAEIADPENPRTEPLWYAVLLTGSTPDDDPT